MGTFFTRLRFQFPLVVGAAIALSACGNGQGQAPAAMQMPPPAVEVETLSTSTLELTDLLPARVSAFRSAEIRPQVNGIITKRYFEEGAIVNAGDKLYQIDPTLYEAALASAQAQLAVAEANAHAAKVKANRYAKLIKQKAISDQELVDAEASAKQADAQVMSAKAAVRSAEVNLSYTEIKAPIPGIISRSTITEGALVSAQQANALTVIRQLTPAYVDIQRPAAELMSMRDSSLSRNVTIELDNGQEFPEIGALQFSDVGVDPSTGTVNVRALFRNSDGNLLPGMFVRANVPSARIEDALLVPQRAVTRQANSATTVFVVNDENVVEMRVIAVTRAVGNQWLVKTGLAAGERVIVNGLLKVQNGIMVAPEDVTNKSNNAQQ